MNVPIYFSMFAGAIVTGIFDTEPVYTYMFMPFKLFRYATAIWNPFGTEPMSRPLSALLVSVLIAIPVVIIPFFLSTDRKAYIKKIG